MQDTSCIYLDYNATTPIFPQVAQRMQPFLTQHFGNPSSSHAYGRPCKQAVDTARQQVARMLGASEDQWMLLFTSCGTESDNWAIYGSVMAARAAKGAAFVPHVVTSNIEHPAVLECLTTLAAQGLLTYTAISVSNEGLVSPDDVAKALTPATVLVTVMHSNNEVGSIQPIAAISEVAHRHGALMHTDAAQSIGKVAVNVEELGADLVTVVGHKFGAPKGIAALAVRKGIPFHRFLHGGGQEQGMRGGTENVLLAVGLGAAAELVAVEGPQTGAHLAAMRDKLQAGLCAAFHQADVRINGPVNHAQRLPNTLSISIRGLQAAQLLTDLGDWLAASAGSACHGTQGPTASPVLQALGLPPEFAAGTLRLSTGRHTTADDVHSAVQLVIQGAQQQGCRVRIRA
ncbi:hypothetical protein WJX72_010537 [[Myrmecia] bisecta]|uniref:Aminotransferase class V domain-containing protein n=1 Tax=[Myrmecia] bisecta TaxID=41462 RepID=A0AAW1QA50_9CHLO